MIPVIFSSYWTMVKIKLLFFKVQMTRAQFLMALSLESCQTYFSGCP